MRKLFTVIVALLLCAWAANAQFVKQSWDFESTLGGWGPAWTSATVSLSNEVAATGVQSAKVLSPAAGAQDLIIAKDGVSGIQDGYIARAKVWVTDSLVTKSGVIKFFWQSGSDWTWYNGTELNLNQLTPNAWNDIEAVFQNTADFKRLGIQIWVSAAVVDSMYVDDITILTNETFVSDWGIFRRGPASGWRFVPSTTPGNAGLAGNVPPAGPWTVLRGEFPVVSATESKALVVSGTMVFDSAGIETWNALRFGLFYHTQAGTLYNAGTDSARWKYVKYPGTDSAQVVDGEEIAVGGYMFAPPSGTMDVASWGNGSGTQGIIRNSSWISTWGNNLSAGVVNQKPSRAIAEEGTYNFAISVQPKGDGTKEVRFYLVKPEGATFSYWFAGTFIDTTSIPATFNGVCFGLNGGNGAESGQLRGLYLQNVRASLGDPITIPEAPWQAYYIPINNWGVLRRGPAANWQFVPGTFDGNAGLVGTTAPAATWSVIRGALIEPIELKPGRSLKVTGKITFDSAGIEVWNGLRYGLNYLPSAGTLYNPGTDSARWKYMKYAGTDSAQVVDGEETGTGYLFCPPSSTFDIPGWANGGGGTHGIVRNNSSWLSTYGSNLSAGIIPQAPSRALATAGTYDFGISVQLRGDGTKEVKFYLVKPEGNTYSYWWGGSYIDTTSIPAMFNGVCFGLINNNDGTWKIRGLTLEDVQIDTGVVTVPEAPWQKYYVIKWGILGNRYGGWFFEKGTFDGDAGIAGTAPNTDIAAIRGALDPFTPTVSKGLLITGKLDLTGGGFDAPASLRLGIFNATSLGNVTVDNTPQDGDSTRWTGPENGHTGILIVPRSGANANPTWGDGNVGSIGAVGSADSAWFVPAAPGNVALANFAQSPAGAVGGEGTYDFAIAVLRNADETADVSFKLSKEGYTYAARVTTSGAAVAKFNCISFALGAGNTTTALRVTDVAVDTTTSPVDVGSLVGVDKGTVVPKEFALSQNYPNPFNPTTSISYDVPLTSQVTITIYDILGRAVATLVNEVQPAQSYTVQWNASAFSSGVYFCRIDARSVDGSKTFKAVKKLLLLK